MSGLAALDWAIVALYFVVAAVALWHSKTNRADSREYFLAGRNAGWFVVGASDVPARLFG